MLSKLLKFFGYKPKYKPEVDDIWFKRINVGWLNEESLRIKITEINHHSKRIKYGYVDDKGDVGYIENEMGISELHDTWYLESPADLNR